MSKPYEEWENGPLADKFLSTQNTKVHPELFVKFGTTKCTLPKSYLKYMDSITNFQVRNEDTWIVTYPKAGTTWAQEMVWLLVNNLDFEGAKTYLSDRSPYLELTAIVSSMSHGHGHHKNANEVADKIPLTSIEKADQLPSPRVIKSHLPLNLLPKQLSSGEKKPKIIYVVREPKDVCVSYYHHRVRGSYLGTLDDSAEEFVAGYCLYGNYWLHVSEFWERRNEPNILIIKYEDMKEDLAAVVEKVAKFLDKSIREEEKLKLVDHLSFNSMKNNQFVNYEDSTKKSCSHSNHGTETKLSFMRKGIVGSWKKELSENSVKLLKEWNSKNCIEGLYPESKA